MAPSKKSKYKKTTRVNGISPRKDEENTSKTRQRKRKLSDMLGPQWSKEELERFYEAYRKFGKEWKKVAAFVHTRSIEMVEALYTMNKAYLSLPEGTASVVGLIAMMTDHYSVLHGGSESEQESNEGVATCRKSQKRARVKSSDHSSTGLEGLSDRLQFRSSSDCLSLLKKRRTETLPRAVGKRTPRIPISHSHEKGSREHYLSSVGKGLKQKGSVINDDVEHKIAVALAEALQRGGSAQVSGTPNRKAKTYSSYKKGERVHADIHSEMDEGCRELSLGSTETDNGDYAGPRDSFMHREGSGAVELQQKGKRYFMRNADVDESTNHRTYDVKEACSGTEEEQNLGISRGEFEPEAVGGKSLKLNYRGLRRKSKKVLFTADEDDACDALQTLADLSLTMPEATTDTESSVQIKEERVGKAEEPDLKGSGSAPGYKIPTISKQINSVTDDLSNTEVDRIMPSTSVMRRRRKNSSPAKISKDKAPASKQLAETPNGKGIVERPNGRGKLSANIPTSHENKLLKCRDRISSSTDRVGGDELGPSTQKVVKNQVNLRTKGRIRRKTASEKLLQIEDGKNYETIEKLLHCLSSYRTRRWGVFEWFYSEIDYPWFSRKEFVEYLDHVGLGHVPRLTRVEWGVLRSSLGKPRRFCEQFLREEKEKLYLYRESARKHYAELNAGARGGLPTDLAQPLMVGQRVIARHPRTREIRDGSVLTVDHSRYRVQFDDPEGVEFVEDTECMQMNRLPNVPASVARQHISLNHHIQNLCVPKAHEQDNDMTKYHEFAYQTFENSSGPHLSSPNHNISDSLKQQKLDIASSNLQARINSTLMNSQPSSTAQIQAREADILALCELQHVLDKKELILSELKCMNNDDVESRKQGNRGLKDSESFTKQYAAVLFQLSEINEQVSEALVRLRQRNTYQENISDSRFRWMSSSGEADGHFTRLEKSASDTPDHGPHVSEIVESSRVKARDMVDIVQAMVMTSLRGTQNNMEEAIDFVKKQQSADGAASLSPVLQPHIAAASTINPCDESHAKANQFHQIPSELVSRCVATLLMIQKCTERQFPPSEVAQVLDTAVASLQPSCAQNLPIFAEIQKCMGIIRNQILALVPT